jgi:F0F1-type ATP synthase membrane subunit b/b'
MTTTSSASERTRSTASTAADEGKHVAGVAKDEASNVASEAVSQAKNVVGDAMRTATDQASGQTRQQRDRLTGTLRSLGDDLDKMASQADSGLASDLAREASQRAHAISQHLDGREPGELLDDVRRFARERPGTFLLGALGAGVVAGRLLRGTKDGIEGAAAQPTRSTGLGDPTPTGAGITAQRTAPATPALDTDPTPTTASSAATRAGVTERTSLEDDLLGGGEAR